MAFDQEYDEVGIAERSNGLRDHVPVHRTVIDIVNPGRVEIDDLRLVDCVDAENAVAGRLGFTRGDAELSAEQVIQQRRFADIRSADQGPRTPRAAAHSSMVPLSLESSSAAITY